jgi:hypothetical protein
MDEPKIIINTGNNKLKNQLNVDKPHIDSKHTSPHKCLSYSVTFSHGSIIILTA